MNKGSPMDQPQRLVWLCPEFTPYHDRLFAALANDGSFDLRVIIMMGATATHPFTASAERPYAWQMANPKKRIDHALIRSVLAEKKAWFVVSSYLRPTLMATMRALAKHKRPFLYWTDTPLPQETVWTDHGPQKRSWLRKIARQRRLRWIFSHAYRILATGNYGVTAVESLGCPADKSVVFPYWVALGEPPAATQGFKSAKVCKLLGIGQLIYRKGWENAIQAVGNFLKNDTLTGQRKLELELIGDGIYRPHLEQMVKDQGLSANITFSGWLQPEEIQQRLRQADILLHPARWEPYGVVILEAMAAGLAILGSNATAAVMDRVIPGECGYIHQTDNVAELSDHIAQLVNNAQLLETMQRGARRQAEAWPVERGIKQLKSIMLTTS